MYEKSPPKSAAKLAAALEEHKTALEVKDFAKQVRSSRVSMTSVNTALRCAGFRAAAWDALGIPADVELPELSASVIYGDLSNQLHAVQGQAVFISDLAPPNVASFFTSVKAAVQIYKMRLAAAGEANVPPPAATP